MTDQHLPWIPPHLFEFPDVETAWEEPNGVLAAGGDLSVKRLILAYCSGIFPWYNENEPIIWWSPDPRCVLLPEKLHISKSLKKTIKQNKFEITYDKVFEQVVSACAAPRSQYENPGTWISDEMKQAYIQLFEEGYAHSVEAWHEDKLVGGLYGLAIGKVFFGESMFSTKTDASKVAFSHLCNTLIEKDFKLIDGQVHSPHLTTLGFELIERKEFIKLLNQLTETREKTRF